MGVSRIRQFPLAALPPSYTRSHAGPANPEVGPASETFLNEQTHTLCGVQGGLLSACGYQHPDWKKYGSLGCGLFSSASPGAIK